MWEWALPRCARMAFINATRSSLVTKARSRTEVKRAQIREATKVDWQVRQVVAVHVQICQRRHSRNCLRIRGGEVNWRQVSGKETIAAFTLRHRGPTFQRAHSAPWTTSGSDEMLHPDAKIVHRFGRSTKGSKLVTLHSENQERQGGGVARLGHSEDGQRTKYISVT